MSKSDARILISSHSPTVTTGYGRVVRRLTHAFRSAGRDVAAAGFGYNGEPHELPYPVFKLDSYDSPERLSVAVHEFSPDILLTLSDPWTFKYVPQMAQRKSFKWIAYFPLDGQPFPADWKPWLENVDVPVVLSKFTQDCVAEATGRTPVLIYHGVDTQSFRPMDRGQAKELAHVSGHFVVGCVARNQQRKNLPALVKAFAQFAADKPDAVLYLHTQVRGHWDLRAGQAVRRGRQDARDRRPGHRPRRAGCAIGHRLQRDGRVRAADDGGGVWIAARGEPGVRDAGFGDGLFRLPGAACGSDPAAEGEGDADHGSQLRAGGRRYRRHRREDRVFLQEPCRITGAGGAVPSVCKTV